MRKQYQTRKYSYLNQSGFGILEIIIVILVFGIGLLTMMQFYRLALTKSRFQQDQTQATYLAAAALEAVREIRDRDWNNIAFLNIDQYYYLSKSVAPINWQLVLGTETLGRFQRSVRFFNVNRDANDNIVESDGSPDSDTKKVAALVSWQQAGQNYQISLATYLTNWQGY